MQRKWITNEPIFETTNQSLACNYPGTAALGSIPITAGQNITAVYQQWVHTVGPMIAWMTDCKGPCSDFDPTDADWFKIGEKGLLWGTIELGGWFQKEFSRWDGSPSLWSETVPKDLKPGNYLLRNEIISLHSSHKPQFYPECAHLVVSGDGDAFPGKEYMAKIPGVWSMDRKSPQTRARCRWIGRWSSTEQCANDLQNRRSIWIRMTQRLRRRQ